MFKIIDILLKLLDCRKNSAISFDDANENESYSAQIYWEYLNQLKESIEKFLESFEFRVRLVIKDNIIQIEMFKGDEDAPKYTPFATYMFGYKNDMPRNLNFREWVCSKYFACKETWQSNQSSADLEQIHGLFDNLTKAISEYDTPYEKSHEQMNVTGVDPIKIKNSFTIVRENLNEVWKSFYQN